MSIELQNDIKYPAIEVWAAAVVAQRINGYVKRRMLHIAKDTNIFIMKRCLSNSAVDSEYLITDQDRQQAQNIRNFFQELMFNFLQGSLKEFMTAAFHVSAKELIQLNSIDAQLIACLPQTYYGEQKKIKNRALNDQLEANSTP